MKKIQVNFKKSSFRLVKNIGVFILTLGIIGLIGGSIWGFVEIVVEGNSIGFAIIGSSIFYFLFSLFAFGICKGLSELIKHSFLQRKISDMKLKEKGYSFDEIVIVSEWRK